MQEDIADIGQHQGRHGKYATVLCGAENVGRFPGHAIGQNDSVP
mgnify:CR=1 FL=1